MLKLICDAGGLFAVLTFIHFFSDWIFQSHSEAMVKHNNSLVRAKHCLIYTVFFIPLMLILGLAWWKLIIAAAILFFSHFYEDTYIPVYLWAKYLRRPPGMSPSETEENNRKAFLEFINSVLGKILMIAIDQIIHLSFLWPIVYLLMT